MECFDPIQECCENVLLTSTGSLRFYHPALLGNYTKNGDKNDRYVYKHESEETYLHYNDFGILEVRQKCHKDKHVFVKGAKGQSTMGQDAAITFRNINTVSFSTLRMHSKIQRKIIFSPFTMLKMNFKSAIFGPLQESE